MSSRSKIAVSVAVVLAVAVSQFTALASRSTPTNDGFHHPIHLSATGGNLEFSNVGATKEPSEANHSGVPGGASVWFRWKAPVNGVFTFSASSSEFDTVLAAYKGHRVDRLNLISADDNIAEGQTDSTIVFPAQREEIFALVVDGIDGSQGQFNLTWGIDSVPPQVIITSAPDAVTSSTQATFGFTSSEPNSTFLCAIDGATPQGCTSPRSYDSLQDGQHAFSVVATDLAGNSSPRPATAAWSVDTIAPKTTFLQAPGSYLAATSFDFYFRSSEQARTFCSLDGAAPSPCTSPLSTSFSEGAHTFSVYSIDPAGNVESSPVAVGWTSDVTAPLTTITSGPAGTTNSTSAVFSFVTSESATVRCGLDIAPLAPCTSPVTLSDLSNGKHVFKIQATDLAGNTQGDLTQQSWTIDTAAPGIVFSATPDQLSNSSEATFVFGSSESSTFRCSLDGAAFTHCDSPFTATGLGDGSHQVVVQAVDAAGNVSSATWNWVVDTTAPEVSITAGPQDPTRNSVATFNFSSSEPATLGCSLDGGPFIRCADEQTFGPLDEGRHVLEVTAIDLAGNGAVAPRSWAWTIDITPPQTHIVQGPAARVSATSVTFAFNSNEAATFQCDLDGSGFAPCHSPVTYQTPETSGHLFSVRAIDTAGNIEDPAATSSFFVDHDPPDTVIWSGPAPVSSDRSPQFSFYGSDADASFLCSLDDAGFTRCGDSSPVQTYQDLDEGQHSFRIAAVDDVGNIDPTPAVWDFLIDLHGPDTTVISPRGGVYAGGDELAYTNPTLGAIAPAAAAYYTSVSAGQLVIRIKAVDALSGVDHVEFEVDGQRIQSSAVSRSGDVYSTTLTALANDVHTIYFAAYDRAGFVSSQTIKVLTLAS